MSRTTRIFMTISPTNNRQSFTIYHPHCCRCHHVWMQIIEKLAETQKTFGENVANKFNGGNGEFWVIFLTWPQIPYDPSTDVILDLASVAWLQMWNMNRFRNPKLFESWLNSIWNFLTLRPPRYAGVTLPNPHHLLFRAAFHLFHNWTHSFGHWAKYYVT